jgi:hypothetical protein
MSCLERGTYSISLCTATTTSTRYLLGQPALRSGTTTEFLFYLEGLRNLSPFVEGIAEASIWKLLPHSPPSLVPGSGCEICI